MKHQIMTVMLDAFLMHFPLSFCKNASSYVSMVHLLHRLYGVHAPAEKDFDGAGTPAVIRLAYTVSRA